VPSTKAEVRPIEDWRGVEVASFRFLRNSKVVCMMGTKELQRGSIYTIGHSNRSIAEFVALLKAFDVQQVVDVRTVPKSRHNSQFNEKRLGRSLQKEGIKYLRLEELGGFRRTTKDSQNLGWHNPSFRGFADYMGTLAFAEGLGDLQKLAERRRTAIMCAEAVPWRCHRSLIGDALAKQKWNVFDIMTLKTASKHRLTQFLRIKKGKLIYPELFAKEK
jgi:uncharacterized protein (DUF488 family)